MYIVRAALLAALAAAPPSVAVAEAKPKVAVMEFAAKGGVTENLAYLLGDLVANAARGLGKHEVIGKSDISSMIGFEKVKDMLGCDETSCLAEIGGALGVDFVISGSFGRVGKLYLVNLKLIDPKKTKVIQGVSRQVSGGEEGLIAAVPQAVAELFGLSASAALAVSETRAASRSEHVAPPATQAPKGDQATITFESAIADVELYIDDRFVGRTPLRVDLEKGTHWLLAKAGKQRRESEIVVSEPETVEVLLTPSRFQKLENALNLDLAHAYKVYLRRQKAKPDLTFHSFLLTTIFKDELEDYRKPAIENSGVSFAEFIRADASTRKSVGVVLLLGTLAPLGAGFGVGFGACEGSSCKVGFTVGGSGLAAMLAIVGGGMMSRGARSIRIIEILAGEEAGPSKEARVPSVTPFLSGDRQTRGLVLGFEF